MTNIHYITTIIVGAFAIYFIVKYRQKTETSNELIIRHELASWLRAVDASHMIYDKPFINLYNKKGSNIGHIEVISQRHLKVITTLDNFPSMLEHRLTLGLLTKCLPLKKK
tara:strand:+ start:48084 stop:48416 length:333 start_codon:yes stop_codon:yes gene_type:complete